MLTFPWHKQLHQQNWLDPAKKLLGSFNLFFKAIDAKAHKMFPTENRIFKQTYNWIISFSLKIKASPLSGEDLQDYGTQSVFVLDFNWILRVFRFEFQFSFSKYLDFIVNTGKIIFFTKNTHLNISACINFHFE